MSDTVDILEKTGVFAMIKKHLMGITIGACVVIVGLASWGIGNYATAAQLHAVESQSILEMKKLEKTHTDDNASLQAFIMEQHKILRKERADDEIFALDLKKDSNGKLTREDSALRGRYERRLAELN